jgi:epoxyqueuosine reductase
MEKSKPEKTQHHSTVSRRSFMQMLGIGAGAVGLSATTGYATSFKDLDEMKASPLAKRNLPFWVKEVDEPTVKIDWDNMEIFPGPHKTLFNPASWPDKKEYFEIYNRNIESTKKNVQENVPGLSLKDRALGDANCWGWGALSDIAPSWTGPDIKAYDKWEHPTMFYEPKDWGVPKYEGTPEENAKMLRVAGRIMGAADVGIVKLNSKTKKLLYGNIRFEKVEKGYEDKKTHTYVLPDKDLWAICSVIPQSNWMQEFTERMSWACSNTAAYSRSNIYSNRLNVFLRGLGYQYYGGGTASIGRAVGFGVMAGLAEYGRAGIGVSPQFGTNFRTILVTVTDLPLAVTKPIDAGITKFCSACKKCGEMCPAGAISMEDEPFWGGDAAWQGKGLKGWYQDSKKCYSYMLGGEPDCSRCQTVCPFTKYDEAVMHDLVRLSIAKAPALNGIIRKMDDVFGYGSEPDQNKTPWDIDPMDIPLYGIDQSRS